ncbi:MAG: methionyl-tRNA formyltransferase [Acidimicrobiia bacterium]
MSSDRPGVVLVGLGPTTATAFAALTGHFDVLALVRPGPADEPTIARASGLGVPVDPDVTVDGIRSLVARLAPDAVVVSSFDRILPADLVDSCPFVNVHYAPLPRYRGRATVNWAIVNGEPEAAISVHRLVSGLDAGGILVQETVAIGPTTTVTELYDALNAIQERVLADAVARAIAGDPGQEQDEARASYSCTRVPADGEIDWSAPTMEIDRLVRALTAPFPGAFTWLGLDRLWIDAAEPAPGAPTWDGRIPGRVVATSRDGGWIDVLTGNGVLRVHRVRRDAGSKTPTHPVAAATVVRSVKVTLGLRTADLVERLRASGDPAHRSR